MFLCNTFRLVPAREKEAAMKPFGWINGTRVLVVTLGVTVAFYTLPSGGQRRRPLPATESAAARATLQAIRDTLQRIQQKLR
jgi:hypothetical protein